MTRKSYRYAAVILAVAIVLSLSIFATGQTSFAEAKAYLQSYSDTRTDANGNNYTVSYRFQTEAELNEAAEHVASIGIAAFQANIDADLAQQSSCSSAPRTAQPRTADNSVIYKTISGNGAHKIKASSGGSAIFFNNDETRYTVTLEYDVVVTNGVITSLNNTSFDLVIYDLYAEEGKVTLPYYCTDYSCGVIANYTINRVTTALSDGLPVTVVLASDTDTFAILTTLE